MTCSIAISVCVGIDIIPINVMNCRISILIGISTYVVSVQVMSGDITILVTGYIDIIAIISVVSYLCGQIYVLAFVILLIIFYGRGGGGGTTEWSGVSSKGFL